MKRKDNNHCLWKNSQGERLTYDGLRQIIRRHSQDADIPTPGLHDFRRCFAFSMYRNGVDNITLARLMGHSSLEVLKGYLDIQDYDLMAAYLKGSPLNLLELSLYMVVCSKYKLLIALTQRFSIYVIT